MKTFDDYLTESIGDKHATNIGREGKPIIGADGAEIKDTVVITASKNDVTYVQKVKSGIFELISNSNYFGGAKAQSILLDKKSVERLLNAISKM